MRSGPTNIPGLFRVTSRSCGIDIIVRAHSSADALCIGLQITGLFPCDES